MNKVKLYVRPAKDYFKLMLKPSLAEKAKNDIGVLWYKDNRIMIQRATESFFTESTYVDRLEVKPKTGVDDNFSYDLICESEEEAFKILNDLFDVEEMGPHERISRTIKLPVDVINQLKELVKNPEGFEGETKEYPVSDHVLQWIKKVK